MNIVLLSLFVFLTVYWLKLVVDAINHKHLSNSQAIVGLLLTEIIPIGWIWIESNWNLYFDFTIGV